MAGVLANDRALGAKARRLILDEVIRLFETDPLKLSQTEHETKRELLLRMAANTLPRLTEVTGEDGGAVKIQVISYGDNDSVQLAARAASVGDTSESSEIQSNSVASESTQDNSSD